MRLSDFRAVAAGTNPMRPTVVNYFYTGAGTNSANILYIFLVY